MGQREASPNQNVPFLSFAAQDARCLPCLDVVNQKDNHCCLEPISFAGAPGRALGAKFVSCSEELWPPFPCPTAGALACRVPPSFLPWFGCGMAWLEPKARRERLSGESSGGGAVLPQEGRDRIMPRP